MIVKEISFSREKLISGIDKIANAVKSTLGARGMTVLIESENHIGGLTVTKDGVTVANSIVLMDPTENLAVSMMKQAADKTATVAGDGTTTAIVIAQAIIHSAESRLRDGINKTEVIRAIRRASDEVQKRLAKASRKVNNNLPYVATISANNDREIGKIIADAHASVGRQGSVTVENSQTDKTYSEVTRGMRIDRGWTSKYFLTDQKKQEVVLERPYILISDKEIETLSGLEHILEPIIAQKRSLLIIAEVSEQVIQTLNVNKMRGVLKVCQIVPPNFGYRRGEVLEDIACATGGKYISDGTGDNFELVHLDDLGEADKVIIGRTHTTIMTSERFDVSDRVAMIEQEMLEQKTPGELSYLKERVGSLTGGVAVIYVGASSDIEQKELRDRVDDAVCATAAALEGGILPGGGVALMDLTVSMAWGTTECERVAWHILKDAMEAPFRQILTNSGMDHGKIMAEIRPMDPGTGIDVVTGKIGNMVRMGIIDPAKVTINALANAVSVATTIMSTNCIITNVRANDSTK
jgi:chaperonin GroEL